jgi:hypothetical protein
MTRTRVVPILALAASWAMSACGRSSPTAPPSPDASPSAPAVRTTLYRLSGVVTEGNRQPVPGVSVEVRAFVGQSAGQTVSTTTGAGGVYSVEFDAVVNASSGCIAQIATEKPGYEPGGACVTLQHGSTGVMDLRAQRIVRIAPGDSAQVVVSPDDPYCGLSDEWVCRPVRIAAPDGRPIVIEVVPDGAPAPEHGLEIWRPSYACCAPSRAVAIPAGGEIVARVLMGWRAPAAHGFTVRTSLAP